MNILITGASKGIGKAITLSFCKNGNHKLILISRDKIRLGELKVQSSQINPSCTIIDYPIDLTNVSDLTNTAERISKDVNNIDILINNAGGLINKKFEDFSDVEIMSMFSVNFFAPALLIKRLLPLLLKSERAQVINIGSMGGFQGSQKYPGLAYYSASKGAIGILTECLASEYKHTGIFFNCLALGAVQTEMFSEAFPGSIAPIQPSEMADYIVNFAMNPGDVNGKIIPVILKS